MYHWIPSFRTSMSNKGCICVCHLHMHSYLFRSISSFRTSMSNKGCTYVCHMVTFTCAVRYVERLCRTKAARRMYVTFTCAVRYFARLCRINAPIASCMYVMACIHAFIPVPLDSRFLHVYVEQKLEHHRTMHVCIHVMYMRIHVCMSHIYAFIPVPFDTRFPQQVYTV